MFKLKGRHTQQGHGYESSSSCSGMASTQVSSAQVNSAQDPALSPTVGCSTGSENASSGSSRASAQRQWGSPPPAPLGNGPQERAQAVAGPRLPGQLDAPSDQHTCQADAQGAWDGPPKPPNFQEGLPTRSPVCEAEAMWGRGLTGRRRCGGVLLAQGLGEISKQQCLLEVSHILWK